MMQRKYLRDSIRSYLHNYPTIHPSHYFPFITLFPRTTIRVYCCLFPPFRKLRLSIVCVVAFIVIALVYCITISIRSRHYLSSIVRRLGHMWASPLPLFRYTQNKTDLTYRPKNKVGTL